MSISITQKEIADMALAHLGQESLSSYDENTRNARAIRKFYELARIAVLEDGVWSFSTKRQVLAPLTAEPAFGWDYEFEKPSDFLKEQIVANENDVEIDYEIEGQGILCDNNIVHLIYTFNNEDLSLYSAKFLECFAWKLAAKAAYEITGSRSEERQVDQAYKIALFDALSNDSKGDSYPYVKENSSWLIDG